MGTLQRRQRSAAGGGALWLVLVTVVAACWPLSLGPILRLASTGSWRSHECRILESAIERVSRPKAADAFRLRLRYEYDWAGRTYHGQARSLDQHPSGMERLQSSVDRDAAERYRVDARVPCWIDPEAPEQAVLERRISSLAWVLAVVPAILLVATGGATLDVLRRLRPSRDAHARPVLDPRLAGPRGRRRTARGRRNSPAR